MGEIMKSRLVRSFGRIILRKPALSDYRWFDCIWPNRSIALLARPPHVVQDLRLHRSILGPSAPIHPDCPGRESPTSHLDRSSPPAVHLPPLISGFMLGLTLNSLSLSAVLAVCKGEPSVVTTPAPCATTK